MASGPRRGGEMRDVENRAETPSQRLANPRCVGERRQTREATQLPLAENTASPTDEQTNKWL